MGIQSGIFLKHKHGFILPVLLVVSLAFLIMSLSMLQVGSAVTRSIADQNWTRIAKEAKQAGISYATNCLKNDSEASWTTLTPKTDCKGQVLSGGNEYYASDTSADASPKWRAKFAVSTIGTDTYGKPRAKVVGTVELLASTNNVVTKTYTSDATVIINVVTAGSSASSEFLGDGWCIIKVASGLGDQLHCRSTKAGRLSTIFGGTSSSYKRFVLPSGVTALDYKFLYDVSLQPIAVCVHGSNLRLYCTGENSNGQLGVGSTSDIAFPISTPAASFGTVQIAKMWDGYAISDSHLCVVENGTGKLKCSGENGDGQMGKGNQVSTNVPADSFTSSNFAPRTVKKALTYKIATEDSASSGLFQNNGMAHVQCVISSDDQVYCAGRCSYQAGHLLFGNGSPASYGNANGTKACTGRNAPWNLLCLTYSQDASNSSPAPNSYSCPLLISGVTNPSLDFYYNPVRFQLPAGIKVNDASISLGGANSICVNASNDKTYCTRQDDTTNYRNVNATSYPEPVALEDL